MANEYLRLKKIDIAKSALVPTPEVLDYYYGDINIGVSVPVEYTITGRIHGDVKIGKPMMILRDTRNGIEVPGIMITSCVKGIEPKSNGLIIHTDNSIYDLEWIEQ